jgi:GNAT superfamily N-acetyltransferase
VEDHRRWLSLWDSYNAFHGRAEATALPHEVTRITWERFLDPAEPVNALVAERGDELVGFTHYIFHRSTTLIQPICYMQDVFTLESARGQGIGRALIEAVYEQTRAEGSSRVYWQTHETNAVARRLYEELAERSGFIVYGKVL